MTERALRILQVSTYDTIGGAERVAWNLFDSYRGLGYDSRLAVGYKLGHDPDVLLIPNHEQPGRWARFLWDLHSRLQPRAGPIKKVSRFAGLISMLAEPGRELDRYRGIEDFRFPGTWKLLHLTRQRPDIIHCHNLHGSYFDLRALPWLSRQVPLVLTLHDAWLLSGHCAHSLGCERWKTGCGHCPDLSLDPPIRQDATATNWGKKREIFRNSRIYVATPSRWLMQKVEQSILATGIIEDRVIPNGVDLSIFRPADIATARAALHIRAEAKVLLFTANALRRNTWKDYDTIRTAVAHVVEKLQGHDLLLLALGDEAAAERIGTAEVRFVPYQKDIEEVARYYRATDIYVHAARADTFPNTVLEALACGTPVVATAVGGIPEQVEDGQTGFLVPPGDAGALAARLVQLLADDGLRQCMGTQAAKRARQRFDLKQQANAYLGWYRQVIQQHALDLIARGS